METEKLRYIFLKYSWPL